MVYRACVKSFTHALPYLLVGTFRSPECGLPLRIRTLTRTRNCLIYVARARVLTLICEFLPSFSTFLPKNLHISRKSSTFALAIGTKRTHRLFIETYKPIQTNIVILQYVGGIFLWFNTRAKPARKGSVQFFFIKTDRYSSASRAQPTHSLA